LQASDHSLVVADLAAGELALSPEDADGDGIPDAVDNCVWVPNPDQTDFNLNAIGDACEDSDGDGLSDALELSLYNTNPLSTDTDGNGISDPLELCPCGMSTGNPCVGDLNEDNTISIADLLVFLGIFGQPC
jgi:hypothetical protein